MAVIDSATAAIFDRLDMIGSWIAVLLCLRNSVICGRQWRRTKKMIHLFNLAQVLVLLLFRVIWGSIPLFNLTICWIFPYTSSLWHITYLLMYTVMLLRCLVVDGTRNSRLVKIVGPILLFIRFSVWPFELTTYEAAFRDASIGTTTADTSSTGVTECPIAWESGVLYLNLIADALASGFLGGMFIQRLRKHLTAAKWVGVNTKTNLVEQVARKSLYCLIAGLFLNTVMNVLKISDYLDTHSDDLTVFFHLAESTLIVEALRADSVQEINTSTFCDNCGTPLNVRDKSSRHHDGQRSNMLISVSVSSPERAYSNLRKSEMPPQSPIVELVEQQTWKSQDHELYL